ncbi:MAG: RNA polymerase sigma factor [Mangrovibacterium sp.]
MKTDQEYIIGLKNEDYTAFDGLFKRYSERIFAFVFSISKDSFIAEEITQTVFVKVWEKRMQIDEHFSFRSFLFRITYNETISYLRKEKAEKKRIESFTSSRSYLSNETEYLVEFKSQETLAREIIDRFPERRKQIFKLSREQGLTNKEIAEQLQISVKTVENQMNSALKVLKVKLGPSNIPYLLFFLIIGNGNSPVPDTLLPFEPYPILYKE